MKFNPIHSSLVVQARLARGIFRSAALVAVAAGLCLAAQAQATPITVPNFSFENPTSTFVNSNITGWTQTDQPVWYNPADFQGYPWFVLKGVFANTAVGQPDHIDNLNGNQAALMFGLPELGIFQTLSSTYQAGKSYSLTLGVVGQGGGMVNDLLNPVTLDLQLFYNNGGNRVVVGSQSIAHSLANFANHTHAHDFTLDLPTVQAGDAWAGQQIGVEILSTSNFGNLGGYWDLDNVRLNEITPVPEPVSAAVMFVFGGIAMQARRRNRR